jgi:cytochrome b subunit of formate dehydrogenase
MGILLKVLYWLAVLAISLALVVGLILWFESQDESQIEGSERAPASITGA